MESIDINLASLTGQYLVVLTDDQGFDVVPYDVVDAANLAGFRDSFNAVRRTWPDSEREPRDMVLSDHKARLTFSYTFDPSILPIHIRRAYENLSELHFIAILVGERIGDLYVRI